MNSSSTGSSLGLVMNLKRGLLTAAGAVAASGIAGEDERESRGTLGGAADISLDNEGNRAVSCGLAAGPMLGCLASAGFAGSEGFGSSEGVGCGGLGRTDEPDVESFNLRLKDGLVAKLPEGADAAGGWGATKCSTCAERLGASAKLGTTVGGSACGAI